MKSNDFQEIEKFLPGDLKMKHWAAVRETQAISGLRPVTRGVGWLGCFFFFVFWCHLFVCLCWFVCFGYWVN